MTTKETTQPAPLPFDPVAITGAFEQGSLHAANILEQNELAARLPEVEPPFRELAEIALTNSQRESVAALQETAAGALSTLVAEQTVREQRLGTLLGERREATTAHLGARKEKAAELRLKKQEADKIVPLPEDQANAVIAAELRALDLADRNRPETQTRVRTILEAIREVREARKLGALAGRLLVVPELLQEVAAVPEEKLPAPDQPPKSPAKPAAPRRRAKTGKAGTTQGPTNAEKAPNQPRTGGMARRIADFLTDNDGTIVTANEVTANVFDADSPLPEANRRRYVAVLLAPTNLPKIRAILRTPADAEKQPKDVQVGTRITTTTTKRGPGRHREQVYRSFTLDGETAKVFLRKFTEPRDDGVVIEWEKPASLKTSGAKKAPASGTSGRTKPASGQPKTSPRQPKARTPEKSTETGAAEQP